MTTAISYATEADATAIATELAAARQAGWTRPELAELADSTSAKIWRAEQGRVHADEFASLRTALDKIALGDVQPRAAQRVDARQARINAALAAIEAVPTKATRSELNLALVAVAVALRGVDVEGE